MHSILLWHDAHGDFMGEAPNHTQFLAIPLTESLFQYLVVSENSNLVSFLDLKFLSLKQSLGTLDSRSQIIVSDFILDMTPGLMNTLLDLGFFFFFFLNKR